MGEKIIELLEGILKEQQFHSKLLELQIDLIQGKQHDHQKAKGEMRKSMEDVLKTVKGTPYESLISGVLARMGGGKNG